MLSFRKPSAAAIHRVLTVQATREFTYAAVGATAGRPPAGYVVDHTRIRLGQGEAVFQAARTAFEGWRQFDLGWLEAAPSETPIQTGAVVAVVAHSSGLWWVNACRIVYVVDDSGATPGFGFAYGTLPDHVARGEERFLIEWDRAENQVWYDILAFSRPNHVLTRLGSPLVRRIQRRFGRESAAAMLKQSGSSSRL